MDTTLIEMDPAEAKERAAEYAALLRRRYDEEHAAVKRGLDALAAGESVLSLSDAIRSGGFDEQMRPRLAIGRADRREVEFTWFGGSTIGRFDCSSPRSPVTTDTLLRTVDLQREHGLKNPHGWGRKVTGYALVPMVPPAGIRKIGGGSKLRHHFVLWEVEQWADRRHGVLPDLDPYLLRHLGGDLYAVVHEWDLTEIERAVMAGRIVSE